MMVLVSYDVETTDKAGRGGRRRGARECQKMGQRVQHSVFECVVDPAQFEALRAKLVNIIDEDVDSLRFYFLGKHWRRRVLHVGAKPSIDPDSPLLV